MMSESRNQKTKLVLRQIAGDFPAIQWVQLLTADGLTIAELGSVYHNIDEETPPEPSEENRPTVMGVALLSLSERVAHDLRLGKLQVSITIGENQTFIVMPIGMNVETLLSMAIEGHPSIDVILDYFEEHDYLAQIEAIWK